MVDSFVLSQLRQQLPADKRCFTGEEFVGKVIEIGCRRLSEAVDGERGGVGNRGGGGGGGSKNHVLSPTGELIEYNEEYAGFVAQYLLDEAILLHVPSALSSDGSSVLLTPAEEEEEEEEEGTPSNLAPRERTDSLQLLGGNSAVSFVSGTSDASLSPGSARRAASSAASSGFSGEHYERGGGGGGGRGRRSHHRRHRNPHNNSQGVERHLFVVEAYYRFASSEDSEFAFFQSQVLVSSSHLSSLNASSIPAPAASRDTTSTSLLEATQDFDSARQGTLSLVCDLLSQRARRERVAKQFFNSPIVQEHRRQVNKANCDLIFKM